MATTSNNDDMPIPIPTTPTPSIRFIVTGFGPFNGVPTNPTSQIVEQLLETYPDMATTTSQVKVQVETQLLEVSTKAVKVYLDQLLQEVEQLQKQHVDNNDQKKDQDHIVLLHLGVHYRGKGFQLETCAYNDATFRVPDEQGYRPTKECVVSGVDWNQVVQTNLHVQDLCDKLQPKYTSVNIGTTSNEPSDSGVNSQKDSNKSKEGEEKVPSSKRQCTDEHEHHQNQHCKVFASTDPGRFVCNYIYCYSLNKFCASDNNTQDQNDPSSVGVLCGCSVVEDGGFWPSSLAGPPKQQQTSPKVWSLFLHVPPAKASNVTPQPTKKEEEDNDLSTTATTPTALSSDDSVVIPIEIQLQFVKDLMEAIQEQILS